MDNYFLIIGKTKDGKKFRPSDWTERLACTYAMFASNKTVIYHPMIRPTVTVDGTTALMIAKDLEIEIPNAYIHVMKFAADNNLRVEQYAKD